MEVAAAVGVSVDWLKDRRPHLGVEFEVGRDWRGEPAVTVAEAELLVARIRELNTRQSAVAREVWRREAEAKEAQRTAEAEAAREARLEAHESHAQAAEAYRQQKEAEAAQLAVESERKRWEKAGRPPTWEQVADEYDKQTKARTV